MHRRPTTLARLALPLALVAPAACGDETGRPSPDDGAVADAATTIPTIDAGVAVVDGGSASAIDISVDTAAAMDSGGDNLAAARGIVVVSSDYISSSISLLDSSGGLVKDGCFKSEVGGGGPFPSLSGDVVLPTQMPPDTSLLVIDRTSAVLTWLDPVSCAPLRQLAVSTGFRSNPHDVVSLSAAKAYVTRSGRNNAATPAPDDFDDGNDLLIIDPSQPAITGRIDLGPFAPETTVLPCADRALLADGRVFVSLNAISADFKAYGAGRVVVVDPGTDRVTDAIDLPGLKNCGAMTYLSAARKLLVACGGAYSDGPKQMDSSGIAIIDLAASPAAMSASIAPAVAGGRSFSNGTIAALDEDHILAVTPGEYSNLPPDRVWSLSLAGAPAAKAFESSEAFAVGAVLADTAGGRIVIGDGTGMSLSHLRFFDHAHGVYAAGKTVNANPSQKLPARALAWCSRW